MGTPTTRSRTGGKRLLIIYYFIKITTIFLFFCMAALLYGQKSPSNIEVKITTNKLSIEQELEIEIIIKHDTSHLKAYRDTPRFTLGRNSDTVQLIQSSILPEHGGLHLRYHYCFNSTGYFQFFPKLIWQNRTQELTPLHITVHGPKISEHTPFLWQIYSLDGTQIPNNIALEQGAQYILCLTATFYSTDYEERYHALMQAAAEFPSTSSLEKGSKKPDGQDINQRLPLPTEILRIECLPSENAALKPIELSELPFAATTLFTGKTLSNQIQSINRTALSSTNATPYVLALFHYIPLKTGTQPLPVATIQLATGAKAVSSRESYLIEQKKMNSEKFPHTYERLTAPTFEESLPAADLQDEPMNEQEKCAAAHQVAEYRRQEIAALFSPEIRQKRQALEAALRIAHPLPMYPRLFALILTVLSLLLFAGAVLCLVINKKWRMVLLFVAALCSAIGSASLFNRIILPQGVCVVSTGERAVRRIPEKLGSIVHELSTGESVMILRKTPKWYYIKTAEGITGWVHPQSIMLYCEGRP